MLREASCSRVRSGALKSQRTKGASAKDDSSSSRRTSFFGLLSQWCFSNAPSETVADLGFSNSPSELLELAGGRRSSVLESVALLSNSRYDTPRCRPPRLRASLRRSRSCSGRGSSVGRQRVEVRTHHTVCAPSKTRAGPQQGHLAPYTQERVDQPSTHRCHIERGVVGPRWLSSR